MQEVNARAEPITFVNKDLAACGLDTETPGVWHIDFKVWGARTVRAWGKHEALSMPADGNDHHIAMLLSGLPLLINEVLTCALPAGVK
eukprot:1160689-Pelagomonas_calceolata.AAC.1